MLSIPLWCDCDLEVGEEFTEVIIRFQSHCGAIATADMEFKWLDLERLSIPLWCDCDLMYV